MWSRRGSRRLSPGRSRVLLAPHIELPQRGRNDIVKSTSDAAQRRTGAQTTRSDVDSHRSARDSSYRVPADPLDRVFAPEGVHAVDQPELLRQAALGLGRELALQAVVLRIPVAEQRVGRAEEGAGRREDRQDDHPACRPRPAGVHGRPREQQERVREQEVAEPRLHRGLPL